jgi:hypothetical protein
VPTQISGSALSELECRGQIVHEKLLPDGKLGYGVQFERAIVPSQRPFADTTPSARQQA